MPRANRRMHLDWTRRLSRFRILLLAASTLPLALLLQCKPRSSSVALGHPSAVVEGTFCEDGDVPGTARPSINARTWSSRCGADSNRGSLTLGPFPAPRSFSFLVAGFPDFDGIHIQFENTVTGEISPFKIENAGGNWQPAFVVPPASWRGAPIIMRVIDDSSGWGGWLAVSEPLETSALTAFTVGITPRAIVFLFVGLVLVMATLVAGRVLRRCGIPDGPLIPILALAIVALIGFAAFWTYFASATLGRVFVWCGYAALAAVGTWLDAGRLKESADRETDLRLVLLLMGAIGLACFAYMHAFATDRRMSVLAQTDFARMPVDNEIPQRFAERLLAGESPKALLGDWLSSDRPPLQTGWILLLCAPALAAGATFDTAAQCAGIWFQVMWIAGAWLLLRSLGKSPGVAAASIAATAFAGIFFQNTIFVWPKLGAAAFVTAAFAVWFLVDDRSLSRPVRGAIGGLLAALGWLSHGGVAFALVGLLAFAPVALRRLRWRGCLLAAAVFALICAPWIAYQKLYEPPANRLFKWHLAGVVPVDDRGVLETIRTSYASQTLDQLIQARRQNLEVITRGNWSGLATFRMENAATERFFETSSTFFALGWWNLGLIGALVVPIVRGISRRAGTAVAQTNRLLALGWVAATLIVWVLLMFIGGSTLAHQGSYTTFLVLFAIAALTLWEIHPVAFGAVAAMQVVVFLRAWHTPEPGFGAAHWQQDALMLAAFAVGMIGVAVARAFNAGREAEQSRFDANPPEPARAALEPRI